MATREAASRDTTVYWLSGPIVETDDMSSRLGKLEMPGIVRNDDTTGDYFHLNSPHLVGDAGVLVGLGQV